MDVCCVCPQCLLGEKSCILVCVAIHLVSHVCFRLIQLMEEIMAEKENKTIIFVETKRRCDDLTRRMRRDG